MALVDPNTALIVLSTTAKVTSIVKENRKQLFPIYSKLRYWWKNGSTTICIFGAGGTGKSVLGLLLSGKNDFSVSDFASEQSQSVESYGLPDKSCKLLIPPGQRSSSPTSWRDALATLIDGSSIGVINVVCAGYRTIRELNLPFEQFRQSSIDEELKLANEIKQPIINAKKNVWMITLITKQDLWWNKREEVSKHYQEGEYNKLIEEIRHYRGVNQFSHAYVHISLIIQNLMIGNELVVPTTQGYDQLLQAESMYSFRKQLNSFLNNNS